MTDSNRTDSGSPLEAPRRRWIGPGLIAGLGVLALLVGLTMSPLAALARGEGFFGARHGHDPEDMREHVDFAAGWVMSRIDADEAQTERVKGVIEGAMTELLALKGDREAMRAAIVAELTRPTVDRDALERMRVEQLARFETASQIVTRAIGDVADVLTPEQRIELAELAERFHGRRGRHGWH